MAVDGGIIGQGCHSFGIHVGNRLAVGQNTRLKSSWIHGSTHLQHCVNGCHHLQRRLRGELGIDVRGPIDLLQERIGLL